MSAADQQHSPEKDTPTYCAECGGPNGTHGLVHVRYGNGAGGNRPCSYHHPRCYQRSGVPDDLPATLCDCRVLRMIDAAQTTPLPPGSDGGVS